MTSKKPPQLFTAPIFKTAQGDRLIIIFAGSPVNKYISSRLIKCYWPEAEEVDTEFVATVGQDKFDLAIKHQRQVATTRDQIQHRYSLRGFGPAFKALKGQPEDIFGIARSSTGTYIVEKNTDEVKKAYDYFFPAQSKGQSAPTTTSAGAPPPAKKRAPPKKKPPSVTVTATEEYVIDDTDMYASEDLLLPSKRRKIGGCRGPTLKIVAKNNIGDATAATTLYQSQRLMGPLTRPPHVPMPLLPGEVPLGIETFFGEGQFAASNQPESTETPAAGIAECAAPPSGRYRHAVNRAREGMKKKALAKGGKKLVLRAVKAVELFERICLGDPIFHDDGQTLVTAADRKEACIEYGAVLREIYPELILDAHVLDVKILENMEGTDELQLLRCMERRFIIWKQNEGGTAALQPSQYNSDPLLQQQQQQQQASPQRPTSRTAALFSTIGSSLKLMKGRVPVTPPSAGATTTAAGAGGGVQQGHGSLPRWGDGLKFIWGVFSSRLGDKKYGGVDLRTTDANVSCALNDTIWWNGQLVRRPLSSNEPVLATITNAIAGTRDGHPRLYLTDGSMPDYEAQSYPRGAPGMPCHVDALSNAMLPHAVRSSRSTNLFHFLKNESTGTGTFTLFNGIGPGANLTAFHFETKRRRSYNCATGDYIFQPLATAANNRALMRVHAAVAGRHSRHGQLLPLECYLEEGINMVTHLRIDQDPSLCELCEQSMHAFVTFDDGTTTSAAAATTAAAAEKIKNNKTVNNSGGGGGGTIATNTTPTSNSKSMPLKVSCNDFDLIWDIDATYFMEQLSRAYHSVDILSEEAPPSDGADTWVQSSYLTAEPRTLRAALGSNMAGSGGGGIIRPWACEVLSTARKEINSPGWKHDLRGRKQETGDSDLDSGMDVIVVRTAEKLLDVILKKITPETVHPWVGEVPSVEEATEALKRLIPVINDMLTRALSETTNEDYFKNQQEQEHLHYADDNGNDNGINPGSSEWINACHFSREYLEDLRQKIARDGLQATAAAGFFSGMSMAVNETVFSVVIAHVLPSIFESGRAEDLQSLPAGLLRKLWMHRLVKEREAVVAQPLDLEAVAVARGKRQAAEQAFDTACCELLQRNSHAWGIENAEELQHIEID